MAQASGAYKPILNIIGRAEAPRGYNQIFGRGREAPLTEMTISEVYDLQRRMLRSGSESSAVGRYQFLRDTLKETVAVLGLDPDTTKMTPEIQDQLATGLVGKHLRAYKAGKIDRETLADRLADKWAGLPLANGQSRYKGVGSNNATVSRQAVLDAIDELALQ
jgi:muramidase (phage lysozyme)